VSTNARPAYLSALASVFGAIMGAELPPGGRGPALPPRPAANRPRLIERVQAEHQVFELRGVGNQIGLDDAQNS
jgi:hypothetical protein